MMALPAPNASKYHGFFHFNGRSGRRHSDVAAVSDGRSAQVPSETSASSSSSSFSRSPNDIAAIEAIIKQRITSSAGASTATTASTADTTTSSSPTSTSISPSPSCTNSVRGASEDARMTVDDQALARVGSAHGPAEPIDLTKLEYVKAIGKGMYADVREFRRATDGIKVAIKTLRQTMVGNARAESDFDLEISMYQTLAGCPTILSFLGTGLVETNGRASRFLALECASISLLERISRGPAVSIQEALVWGRDIAGALAFLHAQRPYMIIHRDVKAENILVCADGKAKLGDLGLCKKVLATRPATAAAADSSSTSSPGAYRLTGETGSYRYMAPEVYHHSEYNESVDVFSFGILLWELCATKIAYSSTYLSPAEVARCAADRGLRPDIPLNWPDSIASLLRACWHADPAARPSMSQVETQLECILRCDDTLLRSCSLKKASAGSMFKGFSVGRRVRLSLECA